MRRRASKNPRASKSSLRAYSYTSPWKSFVPDFEMKLMAPPPAFPYSALKPLVSTVNSVSAPSEGVLVATQEFDSARVVLAEMPSRLTPKLAACPPPIWKLLSPKFFDSGVRIARSNGLRRLPPTTVGRSPMSLSVMTVWLLALSVWSATASALTSMACVEAPTSSDTSLRTFAPASMVMLDVTAGRNPSFSTRAEYVPGERLGTVYWPRSLDSVVNVVLVAVLVTTTLAPGITAPLLSVTTPAKVPRSA